jgi:hypothetical protein
MVQDVEMYGKTMAAQVSSSLRLVEKEKVTDF